MSDDSQPLPSQLAGPTWHRFLSPHYDDIALSCGGIVALLTAAGLTPEIVVLFGDQPDPAIPLSPFAMAMHEGWGLSASQVIASRRREEATAALALGATSLSLPFLDAIYRGRHYESDQQLFGETAEAELNLPSAIVSALELGAPADRRVRLYAPLAIGGHVDHRHGFRVGVELARSGWDIWFYEDLPYALNSGATESRLADLAQTTPVQPVAVVAVEATWAAKLAAILAYPSQLSTVFGYVGSGSSRDKIDQVMRAYASRIGDGVPSERFWRLVASAPSGHSEPPSRT